MVATIASWFAALFAWVGRFFEWFVGMFNDLMEFFADLPVLIFKGIMEGVIYLLGLIPAPDFLTQHTMGSVFSALPNAVLYFVTFIGLPEAIAVFGAGVLFRLTRKAMTLGQW